MNDRLSDEALPLFEFDDGYDARVMTPEGHPRFAVEFVEPICRAAQERMGNKITLFSVAGGDLKIADVLDQGQHGVRFISLDLAEPSDDRRAALSAAVLPMVYHNPDYHIGNRGLNLFITGDVTGFDGFGPSAFADVGMAINALIYEPEAMLRALHKGLKPGSQAVVNFTLPSEGSNVGLVELLKSAGATIGEEGGFVTFDLRTFHDERLCFAGARSYGVQRHPRNPEVLMEMARAVGFSHVEQSGSYPVVAFDGFLTDDERARFGADTSMGMQVVNTTDVLTLKA